MSGLIRADRSLWTPGQFKPVGIPRINWAHPLTRGLISYWWNLGPLFIDLVSGDSTNLGAGTGAIYPANKLTSFGLSGDYSAAATFAQSNHLASIQAWTAPYSIACGFLQLGAIVGSATAWFGIADASTNSPIFMYAPSTTTLGIGYGNNGSSFTFTYVANTYYVAVGSATGTSTQASWVNGVAQTAGAVTSAYTGTNLKYCFGISLTDPSPTTDLLNAQLFFGAIWTSALTATDATLLYQDPYCFLLPQESSFPTIYAPSSGAVFTLGAPTLIYGLAAFASANKIVILSQSPTSYADCNTYQLGWAFNSIGGCFGAISSSGDGEQISSNAVAAGTISANGTPTCWAVIDDVNSRLLAFGPATGLVSVTSGQSWTLASFVIDVPKS